MTKKIPFKPIELFKIYESGIFLNPELQIDFQIDRFADRSHLLSKDFNGTTALVAWYDFSLNTLDQSSEYCQLIITNRPIAKYKNTIPQFIVRDLRLFMYRLADYMRKHYHNPLIGVTGSAGKSTTSKMLAHLLSDDGSDVLVNMGNHNNRPSVSFYTSNLVRNPDYMVLEIAGDSFLEDKPSRNLAKLAQPDIGMITSIGGAHLSRYKDELTVAKIKSGLIDGMKPGGLLVVNGDLPVEQMAIFRNKAKARDIKILTYSMQPFKNTDSFLISKSWDGEFSVVQAKVKNEIVSFRLKAGAEGTIQNSLGVLLVLQHLGIKLSEEKLKKFETIPMLAKVLERKEYELPNFERVTIIDDTHNSSVPAMHNAINYFKMLATSGIYSGKKFLILGKIADLGTTSQAIHHQFIPAIAESQADYVFLYGEQMKELMIELRKRKVLAYHYSNLNELIEETIDLIEDKSVLVMKGSVSDSDFSEVSWRLPQKIKLLGGKQA